MDLLGSRAVGAEWAGVWAELVSWYVAADWLLEVYAAAGAFLGR